MLHKVPSPMLDRSGVHKGERAVQQEKDKRFQNFGKFLDAPFTQMNKFLVHAFIIQSENMYARHTQQAQLDMCRSNQLSPTSLVLC